MISRPTASFVVPCYNLGHLLGECISSIVSQSYRDFEVLIVDDCSPDDTPQVARSFRDSRIRHIRNERNLGHLQNYNRGIELAQGRYIWLISADDRLRSPHILEDYLKVMNANPAIGFACCPAVSLLNGKETHVEGSLARRDIIFRGKTFARRLLQRGNFVIAASGMVRRECYEKLGGFPVDLPYAGDWYMWCLFALHHDVAFFREPMVNYRQHEGSMTNHLTGARFGTRFHDGLAVLWRIRRKAEELGYNDLMKLCRARIANQYAQNILGRSLGDSTYTMTLDEFEQSVQKDASDPMEADIIRARTWEIAGDTSFRRRNFAQARAYYALGRTYDGSRITVPAKQIILNLGAGKLVVDLREKFDPRRAIAFLGYSR